ncbi:MAG: rRNA adenine dimethyltransferase family protein, partial [Candidatus Colwellbacteria bacterium]
MIQALKENFQLSSLTRYSGSKRIRINSRVFGIIEGDVLKILPRVIPDYLLPSTDYKLIGNIPYYITGHLLRKVGELEKKPKLIVFTIQKEVAERIVAEPPKMNLLAASVQFWGKPKIVGYVSKKSFRPQPKVDSAIIKITPYHLPRHGGVSDMKDGRKLAAEKYYKFIKILFKQPRKTILNNLREGFKLSQKEIEKRLQKLEISPSLRPANLSMSDINKLTAIFRNKRV